MQKNQTRPLTLLRIQSGQVRTLRSQSCPVMTGVLHASVLGPLPITLLIHIFRQSRSISTFRLRTLLHLLPYLMGFLNKMLLIFSNYTVIIETPAWFHHLLNIQKFLSLCSYKIQWPPNNFPLHKENSKQRKNSTSAMQTSGKYARKIFTRTKVMNQPLLTSTLL